MRGRRQKSVLVTLSGGIESERVSMSQVGVVASENLLRLLCERERRRIDGD
jgi:hypothetical protein